MIPKIKCQKSQKSPNHGHGYVKGNYVLLMKPKHSRPDYTQTVLSKSMITQPVKTE